MPTRLEMPQHRYTPDVGTYEEPVYCGVCGDEMTCDSRGSTGPRGFAQAMSRSRSEPHDVYTCPHGEADWHVQVVRIWEEAHKTPSKVLADMMEAEVAGILATRKATKKVSKYF